MFLTFPVQKHDSFLSSNTRNISTVCYFFLLTCLVWKKELLIHPDQPFCFVYAIHCSSLECKKNVGLCIHLSIFCYLSTNFILITIIYTLYTKHDLASVNTLKYTFFTIFIRYCQDTEKNCTKFVKLQWYLSFYYTKKIEDDAWYEETQKKIKYTKC